MSATIATPTATPIATPTATPIATPTATHELAVIRPNGRVVSFERAIARCTKDERTTLQGRIFQAQLTNGQYRPFVSAVIQIFGQKAEKAAFQAGIGAKGSITKEAFSEFVGSFDPKEPTNGFKGEKALFVGYIRALRG